jgi:hypothetical protein
MHATGSAGESHPGAIHERHREVRRRARINAGTRTADPEPMADRFVGEGLTFDDVLLVPAYSEVHPATPTSTRA